MGTNGSKMSIATHDLWQPLLVPDLRLGDGRPVGGGGGDPQRGQGRGGVAAGAGGGVFFQRVARGGLDDLLLHWLLAGNFLIGGL